MICLRKGKIVWNYIGSSKQFFVLSFLFVFGILTLTCQMVDSATFSYFPSIDGKSYNQLPRQSQPSTNLLKTVVLYDVKNNVISPPLVLTNNGSYDVDYNSEDVGVVDITLKSVYAPTGYFLSIDGVPIHAQKSVTNQPLQFYFSDDLFANGLTRMFQVDVLKKTRAGWTIMQSIKFHLTNKHKDSNQEPDPTGYVPPDTNTWSRYPDNLIVNPAKFKIGPAQEAGFNTADPCVLFDKKTNKWHAYFSSMIMSQDVQVIKHVESSDAINWTVKNDIALDHGPEGTWDSQMVETCSVVSVETKPGTFQYLMYYSGSNTDFGDDRDRYSIGLAVSDNPDTFTRIPLNQSPKNVSGLLFDAKTAFAKNTAVVDGLVTDPDVMYQDGMFKMWFYCAGVNNAGKYVDGGICYATSSDGINWDHKGSLMSLLNEHTVGVVAQQPTVIFNDISGLYEIWVVIDDPAYHSYGIPGLAVGGYYHATSKDGVNWTYSSKTNYDFLWNKNLISENTGLANGPDVVFHNGFYYLFYTSFTTQNILPNSYPYIWGLNFATKK